MIIFSCKNNKSQEPEESKTLSLNEIYYELVESEGMGERKYLSLYDTLALLKKDSAKIILTEKLIASHYDFANISIFWTHVNLTYLKSRPDFMVCFKDGLSKMPLEKSREFLEFCTNEKDFLERVKYPEKLLNGANFYLDLLQQRGDAELRQMYVGVFLESVSDRDIVKEYKNDGYETTGNMGLLVESGNSLRMKRVFSKLSGNELMKLFYAQTDSTTQGVCMDIVRKYPITSINPSYILETAALKKNLSFKRIRSLVANYGAYNVDDIITVIGYDPGDEPNDPRENKDRILDDGFIKSLKKKLISTVKTVEDYETVRHYFVENEENFYLDLLREEKAKMSLK